MHMKNTKLHVSVSREESRNTTKWDQMVGTCTNIPSPSLLNAFYTLVPSTTALMLHSNGGNFKSVDEIGVKVRGAELLIPKKKTRYVQFNITEALSLSCTLKTTQQNSSGKCFCA